MNKPMSMRLVCWMHQKRFDYDNKVGILTLFSRHNFIYSGGEQSNFHYCMMPRAQIWKFSFHSATVCGLAAFYIKYDRVMWSVRQNLPKKKYLLSEREGQQPKTMTNAQRIDKNWTNQKKKLNQNHFSLSASALACWSILILFATFCQTGTDGSY